MKRRVLYLGLRVPQEWKERAEIIHCPVIKIIERSLEQKDILEAFSRISAYTHVLLTSRIAAELFFRFLKGPVKTGSQGKMTAVIIAIGQGTSEKIQEEGFKASYTASEETSEGIIELLKALNLTDAYLFWPHSQLSRSIIPDFLQKQMIPFCAVPLYTTVPNNCGEELRAKLLDVNEIVFTSPSTVDAFLSLVKSFPKNKILTAVGPITEAYLRSK